MALRLGWAVDGQSRQATLNRVQFLAEVRAAARGHAGSHGNRD